MSSTIPPTKPTGLGPPPAPPPNTQGPPFHPLPGPPFQYGYPGPVGSQYHAAGPGMGTGAPQMYYGAPPYPPFGHHGNAGPWGYGHYRGAIPDPFPHPGDAQPRRTPVQARVMPVRAEVSEATDQVAPRVFQPKRVYPNKQVSEGVWLFFVEIYEGNTKRTFEAKSDMMWQDFKDRIVARLDAMEVRLNFRLNVDVRAWSDLSCEADFVGAMTLVRDKCPLRRTRGVVMEVKNMTPPKPRAKGKAKRSRDDDIPPATPSDMEEEVNHLRDLQDYLFCAVHSSGGIKTYCHIELAGDGNEGGHRKFSHRFLTLWAQYIQRGLATKSCPPNIKLLDDPPTKKHKAAHAVPEFHIAVNLAPTPGGPALQGACVVSNSPYPQVASASAPGPSRLEEVTKLEGDMKSCSAPNPTSMGRSIPISEACKMLLRMLSKSAETKKAPVIYDVLTWMDAENPEVDGLYIDCYSDLKAMKIKDAFDIMETERFHLAPLGYLGRGGAERLRQCVRTKILTPLGLWNTATDSISSVEKPLDIKRLFQWRDDVEEGYVEDVEDPSSTKAEEVDKIEVVDEEVRTDSSGIEEVEGWCDKVNVGQWEEEI